LLKWKIRSENAIKIDARKGDIENMAKMDVNQTYIAMTVRDADVMLDFYRNNLGMETAWTDSADPNVIKHYLRFDGGMLKMFVPAKPPEKGPSDVLGITGYRLLTFVVNNMTELCKELEAKGVRFAVSPQANPSGSKWAIISDPEGNLIELSGKG
jgi:catechol 2,3-dioxygenase-like lactoylglutathione lyase family enzyme